MNWTKGSISSGYWTRVRHGELSLRAFMSGWLVFGEGMAHLRREIRTPSNGWAPSDGDGDAIDAAVERAASGRGTAGPTDRARNRGLQRGG